MAQTGGEQSDGGVYGSAVAAAGWQRGAAGRADLRSITDRMLELAGIRPGHRVLDVAAGTGEQTLMAARRVGPERIGVGAPDIADRMLVYLDEAARNEGLTNWLTRWRQCPFARTRTRLLRCRDSPPGADAHPRAAQSADCNPPRAEGWRQICCHRTLDRREGTSHQRVTGNRSASPRVAAGALRRPGNVRAGRSRRASRRFRAYRLPRRGGGNRAKPPTLRLGCRGHGAQPELAARDAPVS